MRVQYYSLGKSPKKNTEELTKLLAKFRYKKNSRKGFILDSSDTISVKARFIRRIERERVVTDPIGGTTSFMEVSFENTRIILYPPKNTLCVIDPPRSSRFLFSLLEEAFGPGFELVELVWEPLKAIELFSAWLITEIKEIECRKFNIGHDLEATIIVKGGAHAISEINKVYQNAISKTSRVILKVVNSSDDKFILEIKKDVVLITSDDFFKKYEKNILKLISSMPNPEITHTA